MDIDTDKVADIIAQNYKTEGTPSQYISPQAIIELADYLFPSRKSDDLKVRGAFIERAYQKKS